MSGSNKRSRQAMESGDGQAAKSSGSNNGFIRLHGTPGSGAGAVLDLSAGEEVKLTVPGLKLHIGTFDAGKGTLYVTTERVAWLEDNAAGAGYSLSYPKIALHAVCKDLSTFPEACIFCQLTPSRAMEEDDDEDEEEDASGQGGIGGSGEHDISRFDSAIPRSSSTMADDGKGEDLPAGTGAASSDAAQAQKRRVGEDGKAVAVRSSPNLARAAEVRLVPTAASLAPASTASGTPTSVDALLDSLFQALSACAELHPDDDAADYGDDDGEGGYGGYGDDSNGMMMIMGGEGEEEGEGGGSGNGRIFRFFNNNHAGGSGSGNSSEGAGASDALPWNSGGWIGDPAILKQLGLPAATDGEQVIKQQLQQQQEEKEQDAAKPE